MNNTMKELIEQYGFNSLETKNQIEKIELEDGYEVECKNGSIEIRYKDLWGVEKCILKYTDLKYKIEEDKKIVMNWIKDGKIFVVKGEFDEHDFRIDKKNISKEQTSEIINEIFDFLENIDYDTTYPIENLNCWLSDNYEVEIDANVITFTYYPIWEWCGRYYRDRKCIYIYKR